MTPFWRKVVADQTGLLRYCVQQGEGEYAAIFRERLMLLGNTRCFDFSSVKDLVTSTGLQVDKSAYGGARHKSLRGFEEIKFEDGSCRDFRNNFRVDLGEAVAILPYDQCWMEIGEEALMLVRDPDSPAKIAVTIVYKRDRVTGFDPVGYLILKDGYAVLHRQTHGDSERPAGSKPLSMAVRQVPLLTAPEREYLSFSLAFLLVLNSPKARTAKAAGSFLATQKLTKCGIRSAAVRHSKVFIDLGSDRLGMQSGRLALSQSPKAYHFVRSHLRRKAGRVEVVRAHWRGDPAFGFRVPTYQLRRKGLS